MAEKLKPCPFCGGEAKLINIGIEEDWLVECPNCHIALLYHDDGCISTKSEATKTWNRRAESVDS